MVVVVVVASSRKGNAEEYWICKGNPLLSLIPSGVTVTDPTV